jgi:hypothetical protein
MNQEQSPLLAHRFQRREQFAVAALPAMSGINHEFLKSGEAPVDQVRDFAPVRVPVSDTDVEGIIDQALAFRLRHPVVHRFT